MSMQIANGNAELNKSIELSMLPDVIAAQSGDSKAFERLILKTRQTITSIALAILRDLDSSEDVAQQVYISVWKQIKTLKNEASFLPWLRQMTRYTAYNYLRDNKVKRKVVGDEADRILADYSDPNTALDENLNKYQQSTILNKFIDELPDESREIVLLYYREEQSSQQVAGLLGVTPANVRQKLSRVRKTLKQSILEKHGKLLLSTAPTIGLSTLIMSSIATSTPVGAAAIASSITTSKAGFWGKLLLMFGGAISGLLLGILAVIYGTKQPLKRISDEQAKKSLIKNRNRIIVWMIVSVAMLMVSYEVSDGWVLPLFAYLVFVLGIFLLMGVSNRIIYTQLYSHETDDPDELKERKAQRMYGTLGRVLGLVSGLAGLLIGLSSRF